MSISRANPEKLVARDVFTYLVTAPVDEEVQAYARAELAKLDARNEKRRTTVSKEQIVNERIKGSILAFLENGEKVASEIAIELELSTQKISALCRQLVDEGRVLVGERKVKGKGAVKAYSLSDTNGETQALDTEIAD